MSPSSTPPHDVDPGRDAPDPGLHLHLRRRSLLAVAGAALASGGAPAARALAGDRTDAAGLDLAAFLERAVPMARELVGDTSPRGERRYLHALAALAVRLLDVPEPAWRPSGQGEDTELGFHPGGDPFVVLHWRMAPGSRIRTHAHTYGNVVTLGLTGAARVRNYELRGEPDFTRDRPVPVVLTGEQWLRPGDVNLVPLQRGYCHGLQAGPEGASGLDITTRLREKQPTPYLELADAPLDADGRVFEGRWTD